jgi:hypothetical protein
MFFEQNIQALLKTDEIHAPLVHRLRETEPITDYEIFEAGDGFCTLNYRNVFLHHPDHPTQEVQEALQKYCQPGNDRLHVILGLGLGYLPDETFRASTGHIVVYEPDLNLLRFILENVNLTSMLGSGRVWLVATPVDLMSRIRKDLYHQYQLDILVLRSYAHLMAEEIPDLMNHIAELETDRIYDTKTGRAFHFQWLEQFLVHLPRFAELPVLDEEILHDLHQHFAGKPAIVISRGPSLDGALDQIKALASSAVLIAVGGALRRLAEAGITPDFAVFYDANGLQEQLNGIPEDVLKNVIFLVSPFAQDAAFDAPARSKLVFLAQNNVQFADWMDATLGRKHHRLDGGGTVSLIAFQAAMAFGCNPIILAGQDLAFPGNQVYAGGIALQQDEQGNMSLTSNETLYAQPETMATTPGQNGEILPTLKAYTTFIRHFEELAFKNTQSAAPIKLYNASLGGAHLEGFPLSKLDDLASEFPYPWKTEEHQNNSWKDLLSLSPKIVESRRLAFQKGLLDLKGQLQQANTLCAQLAQACQEKQAAPQDSVAAIQSANRQFNEFIASHPFVGYWLMFEMIDFRERIRLLDSTQAFVQQGPSALIKMLTTCQEIIVQKALPQTEKAYHAFQLSGQEPKRQKTAKHQ